MIYVIDLRINKRFSLLELKNLRTKGYDSDYENFPIYGQIGIYKSSLIDG